MHDPTTAFRVRAAARRDLHAMACLKPPRALHKDRLRDALGQDLHYLVVVESGAVIGFGLLVLQMPDDWPVEDDHMPLPTALDLFIRRDQRGRGAGTVLIRSMEERARLCGESRLCLTVDPIVNPRAHQLYVRLGYRAVQQTPYESRWRFKDSDGRVHEGCDWILDMVKDLPR